jgi:hypothetical protein
MEMRNVAAFFSRKQPELAIWRDGLMQDLPSNDLSAAYAFWERALLENLRELLVIRQKGSIREEMTTERLIEKCLGSRKPELIKGILVFGDVKVWKPHRKWEVQYHWTLRPLWPQDEFVDFSGSNLESLALWSFVNCRMLVEVVLPDTVMEVEARAFEACSRLEIVKLGNGLKTLDSVFCDCSGLVEVVLPETVTELRGTFTGCAALQIVRFGDRLKTLGESTFWDCRSLVRVVLPDKVTEIGWMAFAGCVSLRVVEVGNELRTLGEWAFDGCRSLTRLLLPDTVIEVREGAFSGCISLKSLSLGKVAGSMNRANWCVPASADVIIRG